MIKIEPNPKVDFFFNKAKQWQAEYDYLRTLILSCGLNELPKWGVPCYQKDDVNILLMHGFKNYCALLFFKGVLMKDPEKLLIQQTKNVQSARQLRFTSLSEIKAKKRIMVSYIQEAIAIEKSGLKVDLKKTNEFEMPDELKIKFAEIPDLKKAFKSLTPGRQRAYLLYFSSAKQSKTREDRIEKYRTQILNGKGLDD